MFYNILTMNTELHVVEIDTLQACPILKKSNILFLVAVFDIFQKKTR